MCYLKCHSKFYFLLMKSMNHNRDVINNQFPKSLQKTKKLCFLKTVIFESKRLVVKCFGGWNTGPWIIDFSQNTIRSQEITMKSKMIKAMFFGAWWRKRSDFWPNEIKICWLRSMDSFYFDYQLISHWCGYEILPIRKVTFSVKYKFSSVIAHYQV